MEIELVNPKTGDIKTIIPGFDWVLFLFSGFLGAPLFLRGLHAWGALFVFLLFLRYVSVNFIGEIGKSISIALYCLLLALDIWLGLKGNEITVKKYLERGWIFSKSENNQAKFTNML